MDRWMDKQKCGVDIQEYYLALKRAEVLICYNMRNLITPSEISK